MKTVYIDKSYNFCPHFSHIFYVGGTVTQLSHKTFYLQFALSARFAGVSGAEIMGAANQ